MVRVDKPFIKKNNNDAKSFVFVVIQFDRHGDLINKILQ